MLYHFGFTKNDNLVRPLYDMLFYCVLLTLSWQRPLSYRNQFIDLQSKSMDWFLYDNDLHHERVNMINKKTLTELETDLLI